MWFRENHWNAIKQPILNSREQIWNTEITINNNENLKSLKRIYNYNVWERRFMNNTLYLIVICSRASTSVRERPAENITSKRPRTWGSNAGPIAFAMLPTQAKASGEGLPLRGAIYRQKKLITVRYHVHYQFDLAETNKISNCTETVMKRKTKSIMKTKSEDRHGDILPHVSEM